MEYGNSATFSESTAEEVGLTSDLESVAPFSIVARLDASPECIPLQSSLARFSFFDSYFQS